MNSTGKIKGVSIFVFVIFSALFFYHVSSIIRISLWVFAPGVDQSFHFDPFFFYIFIGIAFHAVLYAVCFILLRTILKDETPFKKKTAILLKIIALFFISRDIEGIFFTIYSYFQFRSSPAFAYGICSITGENLGLMAISILWFGGVSIIAGFIIYLISLVIDYGISLQTQVDETL